MAAARITSDKPAPRHSINSIRKDGAEVEPYILVLADGTEITFRSPEDLDAESGVRLMRAATVRPHEIWEILGEWLSEKELVAIRKEKLTLGQVVRILEAVKSHFEEYFGHLGN